MFTKNKYVLLLTVLLTFTMVFSIGCSSGSNSTPESPEMMPQSTEEPLSTQPEESSIQPADDIAQILVKDIPEVSEANVMLLEQIAYVSIKIEATSDQEQSLAIKDMVVAKVKEADTTIKDVFVSEDADTFMRFKEMSAAIRDGKPISGFVDEIKTMFSRVMPTT